MQTYFKLLNKNENHNGFQFKTGLNVDNIPFNLDKNQKCISGGIYFSKSQNILKWITSTSYWIREVIIPKDANVIEFEDKLRADKVILKERMSLFEIKTWEYIIKHGVDIHANNDYGLTWACYNGHFDIVKYLVEQGADIHAEHDYALQCAAYNGHFDIVKYLVEQGADIHANDDYALQWAAHNGHFDIVKYLVEHGADIHIEHDFALRWAAHNGHFDIVKYLVEQEADIHADNDFALQWAAQNGHFDIVKYLADHVTNIHTNDDCNLTCDTNNIIEELKNNPDEFRQFLNNFDFEYIVDQLSFDDDKILKIISDWDLEDEIINALVDDDFSNVFEVLGIDEKDLIQDYIDKQSMSSLYDILGKSLLCDLIHYFIDEIQNNR